MGVAVRWGFLSTARINDKVLAGARASDAVEVVAVASRDAARARAYADERDVPRAHGSYEALLADPQVDAVYIGLPNALHVEWTIRALEAGKHVLVEKPFDRRVAPVERAFDVAQERGLVLSEGFMWRHHPQARRLSELVGTGAVGEVRLVRASFSFPLDRPGDVRWEPGLDGGALMDVGCYALNAARFLFDAEPKRVVSLVERDPALGIDRLTTAIADFGGGRHLDFTVGTQIVPYQRVQVLGTEKRLEVLIPFNAIAGEAMQMRLDDGARKGEGTGELIGVEACDQYCNEIDAFSRAVRGEARLAYGIEDAIANMRVLDALFRSEKSGAWEKVGG